MRLVVSALASLSWASLAYAAVDPLFVTGLIDGLAADSADATSGGTVTVNGFQITVPKNLIVQFPAAWVPWKDVVAAGLKGYEVSITGNVVDGTPIAGQIELAQTLLNAGNGVIKSVNLGDNFFTLVSGTKVVLNDPNAVYSVGYKDQPLFTADDENPSITAFSGFPMCIPRSATDDRCPLTSRSATTNPGQDTFAAKNATVMAPFIPGDYVEFSGITVGGVVYAYEVVAANVQITTSGAKGEPVYIRMEDAIIGVFDPTTGVAANNEFGDTRFIGYTSDSDNTYAAVTVSAIDVDRCSGEETYRTIGSASLKAGDARNKFIFRADSTTLSKYTREYRIVTAGGIKKTANGIAAGQYVQPVTEWIFPEPTVPGIKAPALNYAVFNNLANGINQDGVQFGQLSPWPGASAPAAADCSAPTKPTTSAGATTTAPTATSPKANVGTPFTTIPGGLVALTAKDDNGIDASSLTYSWAQVSGPSAALGTNVAASTLAFTAPANPSPTTGVVTRVFRCTVSVKDQSSSADVTVTTDGSLPDKVTIESYTWTTQQGGTINIVANTNVLWAQDTKNPPVGPKLTLQFGSATGTGFANSAITPVYQGNGRWSWGARSTKKPGSIKITSERNGSAQTTSTTARKRALGGSATWRGEEVEEVAAEE